MRRAAVIIGVDRIKNLTPLTGAAAGAEKFAEWADKQDIETFLITDQKNKAVTLNQIYTQIDELVRAGVYGQLIVYFAGHGYLNAPEYEVWLLSGAPDNANEAVNVVASIDLARKCGIQHVAFISDACRTAGKTAEDRTIKGGPIFPNVLRAPRPNIDQYYAAAPGEAAYEVPRDYQGLFTRYLLEGLQAQVDGVTEEFPVDGSPRVVVPSWRLQPFLEEEVPVLIQQDNPKLKQSPEVRVESHIPKYMADLGAPVLRGGAALPPGGGGPGPVQPDIYRGGHMVDFMIAPHAPGGPGPIPTANVPGPKNRAWTKVAADAKRIHDAKGRESFESRTGFTVVGAKVQFAVSSVARCISLPDNYDPSNWNVGVDVHSIEEPGGTALLVLDSGHGLPLAVLPGYIGTVLVEQGRVVNISYVPATGTDRYAAYEYERDDVDVRRAYVAAATRHGLFNVTPEKAKTLADQIRLKKHLDPTLGMYASYAYSRAGIDEEVLSVYEYMLRDGPNTLLFDVALLAGKLERVPMKVPALADEDEHGGPRTPEGVAPTELLAEGRTIAPLCPMLTQGWALLDSYPGVEHDILRKLEQQLLRGLWTTLSASGAKYLRALIEDQAVR